MYKGRYCNDVKIIVKPTKKQIRQMEEEDRIASNKFKTSQAVNSKYYGRHDYEWHCALMERI